MRSDPAFPNFTDGPIYKYIDCIKIERAEIAYADAVDDCILLMNSLTQSAAQAFTTNTSTQSQPTY